MPLEDKVEYHLDPKIRFSCVICNVFKPSVGRFLKCLHVVCVSCARDNISDPGVIECKRCSMVTAGMFPGANLVEQLPFYQSVFRKTSEVDRDSGLFGPEAKRKPDQLCYVCEATEADRIATHHCPTCGCLPLCEHHAERHPLTRSTRDHLVEHLAVRNVSVSSQGVKDGKSNLPCCIHKKEKIVTFCQTCNLPLCGVCLASGHDGHCIQTLTSTAQECFELLKQTLAKIETEFMMPPSSAGPTMATTSPPSLFKTRLEEIARQKQDIQKNAEAASQEVSNSFESLQKHLQEKQVEVLTNIDKKLWSVLDSLEKEERSLQDNLSDYITAVDTAEELVFSSAIGPCSVIQLADIVTERLSHVSVAAHRVRERTEATASVRIIANTSVLDDLSASLDNDAVIPVSSVLNIDGKICEPTKIQMAGHDGRLSLKLADSNGHKVSSITEVNLASSAVIRQPDCRETKASLSMAHKGENECSLRVVFRPRMAGIHHLLLEIQGRETCVPFTVYDVIGLDPNKCSPGIELSDNNKVARCTSNDYECAAAEDGYVCGRHQWFVKVPATMFYYAGVCRIPSDGKFCKGQFFSQISYSWNMDGHAYQGSKSVTQHDMIAWKIDDIVLFTLDCDSRTLECRCERTGERKMMTDLDCTEPLYPAVCV